MREAALPLVSYSWASLMKTRNLKTKTGKRLTLLTCVISVTSCMNDFLPYVISLSPPPFAAALLKNPRLLWATLATLEYLSVG